MPMAIQVALNTDLDFLLISMVNSHIDDHIAKVDEVQHLS